MAYVYLPLVAKDSIANLFLKVTKLLIILLQCSYLLFIAHLLTTTLELALVASMQNTTSTKKNKLPWTKGLKIKCSCQDNMFVYSLLVNNMDLKFQL